MARVLVGLGLSGLMFLAACGVGNEGDPDTIGPPGMTEVVDSADAGDPMGAAHAAKELPPTRLTRGTDRARATGITVSPETRRQSRAKRTPGPASPPATGRTLEGSGAAEAASPASGHPAAADSSAVVNLSCVLYQPVIDVGDFGALGTTVDEALWLNGGIAYEFAWQTSWKPGSGIVLKRAINGEAPFVTNVDFIDDTWAWWGVFVLHLAHPGGIANLAGWYDATNDDSLPIQAALDRASCPGGHEVVFPAGTYPIGTTDGTFNYTAENDSRNFGWIGASQSRGNRPLILRGNDVHLRPAANDGRVVLRLRDRVLQPMYHHASYSNYGIFDAFSYYVFNAILVNENFWLSWYRSVPETALAPQTRLSISGISFDGNRLGQPFYERWFRWPIAQASLSQVPCTVCGLRTDSIDHSRPARYDVFARYVDGAQTWEIDTSTLAMDPAQPAALQVALPTLPPAANPNTVKVDVYVAFHRGVGSYSLPDQADAWGDRHLCNQLADPACILTGVPDTDYIQRPTTADACVDGEAQPYDDGRGKQTCMGVPILMYQRHEFTWAEVVKGGNAVVIEQHLSYWDRKQQQVASFRPPGYLQYFNEPLSGVSFNQTTDLTLSGVEIHDGVQNGLSLTDGVRQAQVSWLDSYDNTQSGLFFLTYDGFPTPLDIHVSNSHISSNDRNGLDCETSGSDSFSFVSTLVANNAGNGLEFTVAPSSTNLANPPKVSLLVSASTFQGNYTELRLYSFPFGPNGILPWEQIPGFSSVNILGNSFTSSRYATLISTSAKGDQFLVQGNQFFSSSRLEDTVVLQDDPYHHLNAQGIPESVPAGAALVGRSALRGWTFDNNLFSGVDNTLNYIAAYPGATPHQLSNNWFWLRNPDVLPFGAKLGGSLYSFPIYLYRTSPYSAPDVGTAEHACRTASPVPAVDETQAMPPLIQDTGSWVWRDFLWRPLDVGTGDSGDVETTCRGL